MSLSDPIADMLTRIRNALRSRHEVVNVRASKVCAGIARVLKTEGYINDYAKIEDATHQGLLRVYLKYGPRGEDVVNEIKRVSKPSRRVYRGVEALPRPMNGLGISIVTTSPAFRRRSSCVALSKASLWTSNE